jgi:UDP-N-acetylmuramyl tripeptide synthase
MLIAFMSQLVQGVDFEAMRETVVEFKAVLDRLEPVVEELQEASSGVMEELGSLGGE